MYDSTPACPQEKLDERTPLLESRSVASHMMLGRQGEQIAADYLRSSGYCIYERNVRFGHDEIDIVAFDPAEKTVVFVEVKTRAHFDKDFPPALGMSACKKERLLRGVRSWIAAHAFDGSYRLDLVCVTGGNVTDHLEQVECA